MPALHAQPIPSHRVARAAWIAGEIRRQHAALLALIPAMTEGDAARLQTIWEAASIKAAELRCLCAELEGLEAGP